MGVLDLVRGAIGRIGTGRAAAKSCVQIWQFWSHGAEVKCRSGSRVTAKTMVERPEVSKCLNHGVQACLTQSREPKNALEPTVRQHGRVCKYGSFAAKELWLRALQALG